MSPAIGEFAIQENSRLRTELSEARAQSTEDHAAMLAALGESMRLRTVNAELVAQLQHGITTLERLNVDAPAALRFMRAAIAKAAA